MLTLMKETKFSKIGKYDLPRLIDACHYLTSYLVAAEVI